MRALALALLLVPGAAGAEIAEPAELPPADYAGQQYVDSKGCLFLRAGQPGAVVWIPRVTRQGVALCGHPPSGNRVPVVEEGAAATFPAEASEAAATAEPAPVGAAVTGYFVVVGSFGQTVNVDKAVARLRALNYPAAQGRMGDGTLVTVFAGPFASGEDAGRARAELVALGFPDAVVVGP